MAAIYFQIPNIQVEPKKIQPQPQNFSMDAWWKYLAKELEFKAPYFKDKNFKSIYLAGIDPANLPQTFLSNILNLAKPYFNLQELSEVSIESSPKSLNLKSLSLLSNTGFNRLVLKVYSLNDRYLRNIGVSHSAQDVIEVIESIKNAGFDNYCVEVTYGHPFQSYDEWLRELSLLAFYGVPHITAEAFSEYFSSRQFEPKPEMDDLTNAAGFSAIRAFVNDHNYNHYDVVNLAKRGYESIQNMTYSYREPYLGLGPGAESFNHNFRWRTISNIQKYQNYLDNKFYPGHEEILSDLDIVNEKLLLGFRSQKGINPQSELKQHLGTAEYEQLMEGLEKAYAKNRLYKGSSERFFFNKNYWLEVDDWLSRLFILP